MKILAIRLATRRWLVATTKLTLGINPRRFYKGMGQRDFFNQFPPMKLSKEIPLSDFTDGAAAMVVKIIVKTGSLFGREILTQILQFGRVRADARLAYQSPVLWNTELVSPANWQPGKAALPDIRCSYPISEILTVQDLNEAGNYPSNPP